MLSAVSDSVWMPVIVGLILGIGLIVVFSVISNADSAKPENHVSIVVIPEGAVQQNSEHNNFEPSIIRIKVNETVKWINHDAVISSVVADYSNYNSAFYNATDVEDNASMLTDNFLLPNKSFEFTFTKTGVYGYHSVPHPWMHGTVIVLPNLP